MILPQVALYGGLIEVSEKDKKFTKDFTKAYNGVFKALIGLKNIEAIGLLEEAKIDIILNDGCIKLDGKSGGVDSKNKGLVKLFKEGKIMLKED